MRYGFEECGLLLPLCVEMMTEVEELQRAARRKRAQRERQTKKEHATRPRKAIFWRHDLLRSSYMVMIHYFWTVPSYWENVINYAANMFMDCLLDGQSTISLDNLCYILSDLSWSSNLLYHNWYKCWKIWTFNTDAAPLHSPLWGRGGIDSAL